MIIASLNPSKGGKINFSPLGKLKGAYNIYSYDKGNEYP